jgi:DNA polymerase III gamma/tau subunit
MQLTEQYRPQTWGDVVGQDRAVSRLRALAQRGLGGRAYWISGQSGTGKTTIARLIAAELAEPWNVEEWDAAELTADAMLQAIEAGEMLAGRPLRRPRVPTLFLLSFTPIRRQFRWRGDPSATGPS